MKNTEMLCGRFSLQTPQLFHINSWTGQKTLIWVQMWKNQPSRSMSLKAGALVPASALAFAEGLRGWKGFQGLDGQCNLSSAAFMSSSEESSFFFFFSSEAFGVGAGVVGAAGRWLAGCAAEGRSTLLRGDQPGGRRLAMVWKTEWRHRQVGAVGRCDRGWLASQRNKNFSCF